MSSKIQKQDVKTLSELTGAGGAASDLINDTQIYVSASSLNKQLSQAITDGDIGGGSFTVTSSTSLTGGGTISINLTKTFQAFIVAGSSAAVTLSSTPFGTSAPANGALFVLVGNSDSNTVSITNNDAAKGCIINGSVTLNKYESITFQYNSTHDRYIEIARNC